MNAQQQAMIDEISKRLTDEGKIIEAGWRALVILALDPNTPEIQVKEMRKAYFLGAQHLFASIMTILEPGDEPTDNDMNRMTLIHNELEAFRMDYASTAPGGRA